MLECYMALFLFQVEVRGHKNVLGVRASRAFFKSTLRLGLEETSPVPVQSKVSINFFSSPLIFANLC